MGWFGDYRNIDEVIDEFKTTTRFKGNAFGEVVEVKKTNTRAAILWHIAAHDDYTVDYFIFAKESNEAYGSYKPLSWTDAGSFVPRRWIRMLENHSSEWHKDSLERYRHIQEEKRAVQECFKNMQVGRDYFIFHYGKVDFGRCKKITASSFILDVGENLYRYSKSSYVNTVVPKQSIDELETLAAFVSMTFTPGQEANEYALQNAKMIREIMSFTLGHDSKGKVLDNLINVMLDPKSFQQHFGQDTRNVINTPKMYAGVLVCLGNLRTTSKEASGAA